MITETTLIPISIVGAVVSAVLIVMNDRAMIKERLVKIEIQLELIMKHFGLRKDE